MRALVSGVAGFAGSHLAELLLSRGTEVFGLIMPGSSLENLSAILRDDEPAGRLRLAEVDIVQREQLFGLIADIRPDRVYHLAAVSSVQRSLDDPRETFQANVVGTENILEAARRVSKTSRILIVSSADAYGESSRLPRPLEEHDALLPVSPYGASKAAAEALAIRYGSQHELHVVRVRPFSHTGARQSSQFVLPGWARQLVEVETDKRPPRLEVGNLEVRRDISDVRDVVAAYVLGLERGEPGAVYNVCSGRVYPLGALLQRLIGLTGLAVEVGREQARMRRHDLPVLAGTFQALQLRTGWQPTIPIEETLRDLLSYWRARQGIVPTLPSPGTARSPAASV